MLNLTKNGKANLGGKFGDFLNVLVTGNLGYIGRVLTDMLLKKGFNVSGFDSKYFARNKTKHKNFRQYYGDIRQINAKQIAGTDAIIHLAALSNDACGALMPNVTLDINYLASIRLAKMAKKEGVNG